VIIYVAMSRPKKPAEIDPDMAPEALMAYFAKVPDPRIERSRLHPLSNILVMSLCAVVCGAESFVAIEEFGLGKKAWLRTFLDLPNGIPSHDTIGRVLSALNPSALGEAFREWVAAVAKLTNGEVVAIDGKTLRRSFREAGSNVFVHMVSAWATANRIVLGQVKTEEKSNEITAIPRLLKLLEINGCLVTIDAMGCQKEIAREIVGAKADYLLAVKDNQPSLRDAIIAVFEAARLDPAKLSTMGYCETKDKGHGRVEVRRCWTTNAVEALPMRKDWKNLWSIALVEVERTLHGKTSTEQRHYICSRKALLAQEALSASRSHWGIENQLHWVLDVAFNEDQCRVRTGHAAENFAVLRHLALNLLKHVPGSKVGIKTKRLRAACDEEFLARVLAATPVAV
jgi:predicted transposase YbfD/YdcC